MPTPPRASSDAVPADRPSLRTARAERKRAAVLRAARTLFLGGYDRVSTDAVAAAAGVSKRTVYDYFGDKKTIFVNVVSQEHAAVLAQVQAAIDEEIVDDAPLEDTLVAFARRILTGAAGSSSYMFLRRLLAAAPPEVAASIEELTAPEQLLAERFTVLAQQGRLRAAEGRTAAHHFTALTFLLALEVPAAATVPLAPQVDRVLTEGVQVFLRAYQPDSSGSPAHE